MIQYVDDLHKRIVEAAAQQLGGKFGGPSVLAITSGAAGDIFAQREKVSQISPSLPLLSFVTPSYFGSLVTDFVTTDRPRPTNQSTRINNQERVDKAVADAMLSAGASVGVRGQVFITVPVLTGACVAQVEPAFSNGLVRFKGNV